MDSKTRRMIRRHVKEMAEQAAEAKVEAVKRYAHGFALTMTLMFNPGEFE